MKKKLNKLIKKIDMYAYMHHTEKCLHKTTEQHYYNIV